MLSVFILKLGDAKVHPHLGKFLWGWEKDGAYTGEAYYYSEGKRMKEGEYTAGRGVCLSSVLLSSCAASLRCNELGKWHLVGWLVMCFG